MFVVLMLSNLMAVSHYGLTSNGFEPSAINLALGGSPVGVVNAWHNDPLNAYDNPALPSLHSGFSFANSHYKFFTDHTQDGDKDLKYSAALASVSYKGIGLLAPFVHYDTHKQGSYVDYGTFTITSEENFDNDYIDMHDQVKTYGLSINLPELYRNIEPENSLFPANLDIALGVNYLRNISKISPISDSILSKANSANLGMLIRMKHTMHSNFQMESAFGVSYSNAMNNTVSYIDMSKKDLIYQCLNVGAAVSGVKKNEYYYKGSGIKAAFENLYSLRLMGGITDEHADDPLVLGVGGELGALDTVFIRMGYHSDDAGKIEGLTYGFGINLHYQDMFSVTYNFAHYPSGVISKDKKIYSYGLSFDLVSIFSKTARLRVR